MKVFISFSGAKSRKVSDALRTWLPDLLQAVRPWISGRDIEAGARWSSAIDQELAATSYGILCVTPENLREPWIHFEAGAVAKSTESHVCPYLIGIEREDVPQGPLTAFQMMRADKADTLAMVQGINAALPVDVQMTEVRVARLFERHWPELEAIIIEALATGSDAEPPRRRLDEMMEEGVEILRRLDLRDASRRAADRAGGGGDLDDILRSLGFAVAPQLPPAERWPFLYSFLIESRLFQQTRLAPLYLGRLRSIMARAGQVVPGEEGPSLSETDPT